MKILRIIRRVLAVTVMLWAVAVTVYFLFFAKISFESVTTSGTPDQPSVTTRTSGQLPWLSQVEPLAIGFMVAFSILLTVAAVAEWRGALGAAAPLTLILLVGTFITGFSIGGLYFPGAAVLLLGLGLLVVEKIASRTVRPIP